MPVAWKGLRLVVALSPVALVACGQMRPVDIPAHRLFMPPEAAASAPLPAECAGADQYVENLGQAMCTADSRRLELLRQAARVTNDAALINSLSWPIGSAVIYEKIRDPSTSLLLPAAVATALSGFFNSGIPGRDAAHRAAASTLTCGILQYTPFLYRKAEFEGDAGFAALVKRLSADRQAFSIKANLVLRDLQVRESVPGSSPDSIAQRTGQVATGGRKFTSPEPQLRAWVNRQVALADQLIALAWDLEAGVRASGRATGLRSVVAHAEAVREAELASKRPAQFSLQDRAAEISKGISVLAAQSGGAALGSITVVDAPLQSLNRASEKAWRAFETSDEVNKLSASELDVGRWLVAFRKAERLSVETRQEIGCPLSAAARQAAAPTTRTTPPATSAPGSPATTPATPSQTPLDPQPGAAS